MTRDDVENAVLRLWTTTRLPIDVPALQVTQGWPREKIQKALDELVVADVLEMSHDDQGTLSWSVRNVPRSRTGPTTLAEWEAFHRISREVAGRVQPATPATVGAAPRKSIVLSSVLSFFLGAFGLFYAAPLPVALVLSALQMALVSLLPPDIAGKVLGVFLPFSGIAGGVYAWGFNKGGGRSSMRAILGMDKPRELPPRR